MTKSPTGRSIGDRRGRESTLAGPKMRQPKREIGPKVDIRRRGPDSKLAGPKARIPKRGDSPKIDIRRRGPDGKFAGPGGRKIGDGAGRMKIRHAGPAGKIKRGPDRLGRSRPVKELARRDRVKHLTAGPVARKIDLDKQFRMRGKGDMARRMGMHNQRKHKVEHDRADRLARHLGHAKHGHGKHGLHGHRGRIAHGYDKHHFRCHFRWPSYYAGFHAHVGPYRYWCPRWTPWVRWSWYYACDPLWDPRPLWCRPFVYVASPTWVWWQFPAWQPMPYVASGTWVDVDPVVVPEEQFDLQLLAVRFVDAGHPDERLGPRYRVWFRNNSAVAIDRPFDVLLVAGENDAINDKSPTAGVRVKRIEAGQTQAVDIRLPFEVHHLRLDEQGQPVPFSTLHVIVDANREIDETSEINNGTQLAADLVLPVDPSVFEAQPKAADAGSELQIAGEGLGPEPGRVLVHLGGIEMEAEIVGWYDLGVSIKVPALPLAAPVDAELIVIRQDGVAANPLTITVRPKGQDDGAMPEEIVLPPALPNAVQ